MITAYAIFRPHSADPLLFLRRDQAELRSADTGWPITTLVESKGIRATPVCWAVCAADGQVSLHSDCAVAELYAARLHGTVHLLVEASSADAEHTARIKPQPRDPQGELTPGGLMRL